MAPPRHPLGGLGRGIQFLHSSQDELKLREPPPFFFFTFVCSLGRLRWPICLRCYLCLLLPESPPSPALDSGRLSSIYRLDRLPIMTSNCSSTYLIPFSKPRIPLSRSKQQKNLGLAFFRPFRRRCLVGNNGAEKKVAPGCSGMPVAQERSFLF